MQHKNYLNQSVDEEIVRYKKTKNQSSKICQNDLNKKIMKNIIAKIKSFFC